MKYSHRCKKEWVHFDELDNGKCPNCGDYCPPYGDNGIDWEETQEEFDKNALEKQVLRTLEQQKQCKIS